MNFDVRIYCERLAKADPDRLEFHTGAYWVLRDALNVAVIEEPRRGDDLHYGQLWAFIGPLADELRVTGDDITAQEKQPDGRYLGHLEATFAAVCMKLEAAKP